MWIKDVSQNKPQLSPQDQLVTLTAHRITLKIGNCTEKHRKNEVCSVMLREGEFLDINRNHFSQAQPFQTPFHGAAQIFTSSDTIPQTISV